MAPFSYPGSAASRTLITVADDFGLTEGVNEAVEQAARHGILTSASLMVGASACGDAVIRAKRTARLRVGLHLVVIEGTPVLPPEKIPLLVDEAGNFPSAQLQLGVDYYFRPAVRRQLAAEIRAQFESFAATGLPLDHANAHKHMHLHPTVGRLMIAIGSEFGLRALRVPAERAFPAQPFGNRVLRHFCALLRGQARRAGLLTNDQVLGLSQTGRMTVDFVRDALESLPPGVTEMYFHPATASDPTLARLMPHYDHPGEFDALVQTTIPADVVLTSYTDLQSDYMTQPAS